MLKFFIIAFALLSLAAQAAPPEVSISVIDNKVVEEGQEAPNIITMEVTLSTPSDKEVSVQLKTQDGQAKAGEDYEAIDTRLVFSPGETKIAYQVFTVFDRKDEPLLEQFDLVLSDPVNATLGLSQDIVTIKDDDEEIEIQAFTQVVEGNENETNQAVLKISRNHDSEATVLIGVQTKNGTALADEDYKADYTTVTLVPGELKKTFKVTVNGDNKFEDHENFFVEIWSNQHNVRVTNPKGEVLIVDDDGNLVFSYELKVNITGQEPAINAHAKGEVALEKKKDAQGNTIYEGRDSPFTHSSVWSRVGQIATFPTVSSVKLYAIDNDFSAANIRVEWEVGKGGHLRCKIPMGPTMNCVWWAGILQYHKHTNWTPPSAGRGGYFTMKDFKGTNQRSGSGYIVSERKENLSYSPQGRVNIHEIGTYQIMRRAD